METQPIELDLSLDDLDEGPHEGGQGDIHAPCGWLWICSPGSMDCKEKHNLFYGANLIGRLDPDPASANPADGEVDARVVALRAELGNSIMQVSGKSMGTSLRSSICLENFDRLRYIIKRRPFSAG